MILRAWKTRERGFRVWVDDVELTATAFYVDTRAGFVRCFRRDAAGALVVVGARDGKPELATETIRGRVRVSQIAPADWTER